jgi:predicted dehydrogenase
MVNYLGYILSLMRQLNVAVIGCGAWGINHARVYSDLPLVRLAAITDIDAKRAQVSSKKHSTNGFVVNVGE